MKIYPKAFENVFSEDKRKVFDFSQVSTEDIDVNEYIKIFKSTFRDFSVFLFDFYIKISWLRNKFCYKGKKISFESKKGTDLNTLYAFSRFLRRIIGSDTQFLTRGSFFPKICSYFKDFFPNFNEGNPFEDPESYKFPYKHITIEFLFVVYQMEDRLELLKHADEQKMTYDKFLDFIINQTYSINEELGKTKYIFFAEKKCQNYVKNTDKKTK